MLQVKSLNPLWTLQTLEFTVTSSAPSLKGLAWLWRQNKFPSKSAKSIFWTRLNGIKTLTEDLFQCLRHQRQILFMNRLFFRALHLNFKFQTKVSKYGLTRVDLEICKLQFKALTWGLKCWNSTRSSLNSGLHFYQDSKIKRRSQPRETPWLNWNNLLPRTVVAEITFQVVSQWCLTFIVSRCLRLLSFWKTLLGIEGMNSSRSRSVNSLSRMLKEWESTLFLVLIVELKRRTISFWLNGIPNRQERSSCSLLSF